MGTVNSPLGRKAQSIFSDLGYDITSNGSGFRATRKWRAVEVTPMPEPREPPTAGELRCFVTWTDSVSAVERRLQQADPDYEWAIVGVADDGDYDVEIPVRG
jgi:hypothetical protein